MSLHTSHVEWCGRRGDGARAAKVTLVAMVAVAILAMVIGVDVRTVSAQGDPEQELADRFVAACVKLAQSTEDD